MENLYSIAGVVLLFVLGIVLINGMRNAHVHWRLRGANERLEEAHRAADKFNYHRWMSVGVLQEILHNLKNGIVPNIETLIENNPIIYLHFNRHNSDQIAQILEDLDEEDDKAEKINVGNVTGIGDDILPTIYSESARLIRSLVAQIDELEAAKAHLVEQLEAAPVLKVQEPVGVVYDDGAGPEVTLKKGAVKAGDKLYVLVEKEEHDGDVEA